MNKTYTSALLLMMAPALAMAGGLVTNTNQNAAFLRQMSQEALIDITGLYMNPAGTAFLSPGSHFSLNVQNARQTRDITTTFPLFALNAADHSTSHDFQGKAYAPVIPSLQWSHNWDRWSINANFSLGGGGGKCEFSQGLGSFEALYAGQLYQLVPAAVNAQLPGMVAQGIVAATQGLVPLAAAQSLAATGTYQTGLTGYSLDAYMKGRQYYFGLSIGATYKVMDNLAIAAGLRGVYATNRYEGYVRDVKASYQYQYNVPAVPAMMFPGTEGNGTGDQDLADRGLTMDAQQSGFGLTPILGIDWRINEHFNLAAKYEMKTRLRFENDTEMNEFGQQQAAGNATLGQFADGQSVAADIPSLFTIGVEYAPCTDLRFRAGYHTYGDSRATQYGDKQDLIDHDTWEITAGVEYDVCPLLTLSCGWQITKYCLSDAWMSDLSFTTDSNSLGAGLRVNLSPMWQIDLGYMHTFYADRTVDTPSPAGVKSDTYSRTNRVLGIGLNFSF